MKIAIIGSDKPDSMESHLKDSFINLGHEANVFDLYSAVLFRNSVCRSYALSIDKFLRVNNDCYDIKRYYSLSEKVNKFDPNLVVCVYRDIHPEFIHKVRKGGNIVIHINPDQMMTLGYQQVFAGNYDAWFTKDGYMYSFMKNNMHLNVFKYFEAFNHRYNPKPIIPKSEAEKELGIEVSTYGTLYPYRTRMLGEMIKQGVDIKLYGVIPHRFFDKSLSKYCTGKYIIGDEKAKVLYGSKIVLNNFHFAEVDSVNCRFFEANGCGAFQLCDFRPILSELLPIDPKLVSYRGTDEAVDKIRYYLAHDQERFEIADTIYNHFINNYTYDNLTKYILDIVKEL